jgi:hypothetical protein
MTVEELERAARNGPFLQFMVQAANDYWQADGGSMEGFAAHLDKLIDENRSRMPTLLIEGWLRLMLSEGKEIVAQAGRTMSKGQTG